MKVTAESIDQDSICDMFESGEIDDMTYVAAMLRDDDFADDPAGPEQARRDRDEARARCAEIWNARHGGEK